MGPTQKPHVSDCVDTPPVAMRTCFLGKNSEKAQGGGTLKGTRPQPLLGAYGAPRGVAALPGGGFAGAP